jgi:hypothetical protein
MARPKIMFASWPMGYGEILAVIQTVIDAKKQVLPLGND